MSLDNSENNEKLEEKTDTLEKVPNEQTLISNEKKESSAISKYRPKKMLFVNFIIVMIIILVATILTFSVIVCVNKLNKKVYKNVYVLDENVSGKTSNEISLILEEKLKNININKNLDVYQNKELIYTLKTEEIEFVLDKDSILEKTMSFGRTGNILEDNFNILKALLKRKDIELNYSFNEKKLDDVIKNIDLSIENRFVDDSYSIDESNHKLIIVNGKTGFTIDYQFEKQNILNALENLETIYKINTITKDSYDIEVDKVYNEVKKSPKDAYINKTVSPEKFVSEELGYDFDINELKKTLELEENKEECKVIEFPINVIQPSVKLSDITYTLYKDKLSGYTTYFDASQSSRANNLSIALSYLNGKIVMPGEIFSYNSAIGETTIQKGYQSAATFKAGKVVMEVGGGICQTSSTLYNVALVANLEIVERHAHGLPVGYVQPSRDATVYSPVLDFKFKNTRNYPVKIVTSFSNSGNMNISIYGTKESTEYEISISSVYISTIPFTTKYTYDPNLNEGIQIVDVNGVNGYTSEGYLNKKLNGQNISTTLLSKDSYGFIQKIIRVGTNKSNS